MKVLTEWLNIVRFQAFIALKVQVVFWIVTLRSNAIGYLLYFTFQRVILPPSFVSLHGITTQKTMTWCNTYIILALRNVASLQNSVRYKYVNTEV
jgi:hypothetical protein